MSASSGSSGRIPATLVPGRSARLAMVVVAAGCALLLGWLAWRQAWVTDDALISFRYVDNLLAGRGLVYNLGERLEAFSSPLFVLLLAALRVLGVDMFSAAQGLGMLCSFAELAMLLALLWRHTRSLPVAAVAGALFCSDRIVTVWATGGLETALMSALVFASFAIGVQLYAKPISNRLTAAVHVLLAAARPEGLAYVALYLLGLWRRERKETDWRRKLWRPLVAIMAPLALLLLARWGYYGRLMPHTFAAKLGGVSAGTFGPGYLGYFAERMGLTSWHLLIWLALGVMLWLALRKPDGNAAGEPPSQPDMPAVILRVGGLYLLSSCLLAVAMGGDYMTDFRFMRPAMGVLYTCVGAALARVLSEQDIRLKLAGYLAALGLLISHGLRQRSPTSMFDAPAPDAHKARLSVNRNTASDFREALNQIAAPGDSILSDWTGYMGLGHVYRTIDCTGLTSPEIGDNFYLRPMWSSDHKRERLPGHARWPHIAFMTRNELTFIFPHISRQGHEVATVDSAALVRHKRYPYLHATLGLGDGRYLRFFTRLSAEALEERAKQRQLDLCWRPPQGNLYCPAQPPPHEDHRRKPLPADMAAGLVWQGPAKPPQTPSEALTQFFTAMDRGDCAWVRSLVAGRQQELQRHSTCAQLQERFVDLQPIRLLSASNERRDGRNKDHLLVDVVYFGHGQERKSILKLQAFGGVWKVVRF